ncbi:GntR family transcriptional regulator [Peribacillus huizhouensis]|uniref:GntR family transcriptional regulator n=1 Tax=Peribacillus huizhouensis TaxID=1501239 RepID=A0ABR6CP14_9BACI|nr:GntR family transcriptional regulator [Peribacillus huizhouensis]MBA9026776.1 GntR family transcriptional regulator [Peribacillus huizhouensis]
MELPIRLSKESRVPIYHQIEAQIKTLITSGHLAAGSSLPSIRALSKDLEISVITIRRAYQDLEYQGFIKTVQGKGTFVAEVAESMKEKIKVSVVYEAIANGVETALQHEYSFEEIEGIFQQILSMKKNKKKEE